MSLLTSIPVLGSLVGKVVERIWPDKTQQSNKAMDIELEEVRQSGGRITPRQLLKYIIAVVTGLYFVLSFLVFFFPDFGPLPDWLPELLPLVAALFGFGG